MKKVKIGHCEFCGIKLKYDKYGNVINKEPCISDKEREKYWQEKKGRI